MDPIPEHLKHDKEWFEDRGRERKVAALITWAEEAGIDPGQMAEWTDDQWRAAGRRAGLAAPPSATTRTLTIGRLYNRVHGAPQARRRSA